MVRVKILDGDVWKEIEMLYVCLCVTKKEHKIRSQKRKLKIGFPRLHSHSRFLPLRLRLRMKMGEREGTREKLGSNLKRFSKTRFSLKSEANWFLFLSLVPCKLFTNVIIQFGENDFSNNFFLGGGRRRVGGRGHFLGKIPG